MPLASQMIITLQTKHSTTADVTSQLLAVRKRDEKTKQTPKKRAFQTKQGALNHS
jgi:hypothetical protein